MSSSPLTPLSVVGYSRENGDPNSQPSLPQFLPEAKNYALDQETINTVNDEVYPLLVQARIDRQTLDVEWQAIRDMEMMQHTWESRYKGRSDAYLPVYAKALDTNVAMLSKGLFPSDEYMDVQDEQGDTKTADAVKDYMRWELERVARIRAAFKPFFRTLSAYGNAPLKVLYNKNTKFTGKVKKSTFASYAQFTPQANLDGLYLSARNPFNVYVYPNTADNILEAFALFEDSSVNRNYVMEMGARGIWANTEQALLTASNMNPPQFWTNKMWQVLSSGNNMSASPNTLMSKRYTGEKIISEVWMNINLPQSAYLPEEDPSMPIPALVVLCDNVILRVCRNPYFHQRPPYLYARLNTQPGFFYGSSIGRRVRPLQYLINDFMNQTNDCGTYGLNPIALINRNNILGDPPPLHPGVKYECTDINGAIKFITPPTELYQMGSQIVAQLVTMAQDNAGAPPILQGTKSAETATSTSILQRNAIGPLQDVVEDLESDVMVPMLHMAWSNAQQFREKSVMVQVAGTPVDISPQDLEIDARFRWLASNQAMNAQQRAHQMIQFLQMLNPQAAQQLNQEGYQINLHAFFEKIWTEAFGFRSFDSFVTPIAQSPQSAQVGPNAQEPGQPTLPNSGSSIPGQPAGPDSQMLPNPLSSAAPRSALEQVNGKENAPPMAPGEGEDFMRVRANADDLAGMFGGIGPSK